MNKNFKIDKSSGIPAYQQIYNHLKGLIDDGVLKQGDEIYSESEMISKYGVSQITVRRAVQDLAQEGYLQKLSLIHI